MAAIAVILCQEQEGRRALRGERVFRDRANPLEWSEEELWRRYRFTREGLVALVNTLEDEITHKTERSQALSPNMQTCTALNFFTTGAVLDTTASLHGISRSTASKTISRVTDAIRRKLKKEVKV